MNPRYKESSSFHSQVENIIPGASQTFSKSSTQYPVGISPLFAVKAKGAYIWDLDDNRYFDLVNSLAAITLGYRNKTVDRSVKNQLKKGSIFSLPGLLEAEVAELIINLVPSAEQVRFGKNGTDATTAAIRLARAYTGRDDVAVCGYHGWQDWYIGSTSRNKGVPESVSRNTHTFKYNDFESLIEINAACPNGLAAVILEPMNSDWPNPGWLESIRHFCDQSGAILIFDETITGFRFKAGGAQEEFNVLPDLTTLGKGIANGFPLAAITGKRELMQEMNEIFFSGTFGGDLISLAAAKAVLEIHQKEDVAGKLGEIGNDLANNVNEIITDVGLDNCLSLSGHPTWKILKWQDHEVASSAEIKTLFLQEMFKRGVLILSSHNVSLSMNRRKISQISQIYAEVLGLISSALNNGTVKVLLEAPPLVPLFRVR
jgi:glutamate-1-semialdehyde 2,1-aminomutase